MERNSTGGQNRIDPRKVFHTYVAHDRIERMIGHDIRPTLEDDVFRLCNHLTRTHYDLLINEFKAAQ